MSNLADITLNQLAAQRAACELNSRPVLSPAQQALSLFDALMAARRDGKLDEARALANELRPLVGYLPETL